MLRPRPDGLSSQEEFDDLVKVDDALEAAITLAGGVYVGRITGSGVRDYFCYEPDGESVGAAAADALKASPAYTHESGGRPDPEWGVYFDLLYPSDIDRQKMGNRDVLDNLERHGDDLQAPRKIEHWIHFADELSRQRFQEHVRSQGFVVENAYTADEGDRPLVLVIAQNGVPAQIDEINIQLVEAASEYGGVYDGWETLILKPSVLR